MDNKRFQAIITGVYKNNFENDATITPTFLKQELFAEDSAISAQVIENIFNSISRILKEAAYEDWELGQLETSLKDSEFSEQQQELIAKFWKTQKPKIHEKLVGETTWNNKLDKLNWRIDSKAKSKKEAEMNELTAIMELHLSNHQNPQNVTSKVVRFEMDQSQLNIALSQIKSIQQQLSKFSS